jgi:hypothetical protein
MKNSLFVFSLCLMLAFSVKNAFSQILPPPSPGPSSGPAPAAVPLDPVSWVMLASGGGLAAKKYYDKRQSDKNQEN